MTVLAYSQTGNNFCIHISACLLQDRMLLEKFHKSLIDNDVHSIHNSYLNNGKYLNDSELLIKLDSAEKYDDFLKAYGEVSEYCDFKFPKTFDEFKKNHFSHNESVAQKPKSSIAFVFDKFKTFVQNINPARAANDENNDNTPKFK